MIARPEELFALSATRLMLAALKLPVESRLTMALAVSLAVGAVIHFRASVPLVVTGEPLTVKSEPGALRPTLVTVPVPVPGNVCPAAKVSRPLPLIFNPVSAGAAVPVAYSKLSAPEAVALLLFSSSACHWNFCATAVAVVLLKTEAMKS